MNSADPHNLVVVSVDHRSAPVALRERLAFRPDRMHEALGQLNATDGIAEAVILSTCNRVELYLAGPDADGLFDRALEFLESYHGLAASAFSGAVRRHDGEDVVLHLFRVSGSIESMVMGEAEILGQVKGAYQAACDAQTTGPLLRGLFETAFTVAKEIRSQTAIGRAHVSVASAAVELAGKIFDRLAGRPIVVIGTGDMAAGIVEHLKAGGADRIAVTSRTRERAEAFAGRFDADAFTHDLIPERLGECDIVLVGTAAPLYLLTHQKAKTFLGRRRGPLLIVDISVPRNVDPRVGELDDCYLYNIDDLQGIVERNLAERTAASEEAAPMLERGLKRYRARVHGTDASDVVGQVRSAHEQLCAKMLEQHADRIGPGDRDRAAECARRLINKTMHPILRALSEERRSSDAEPDAWPLHRTAGQIFGAPVNGEVEAAETPRTVRAAVVAARDAEIAAAGHLEGDSEAALHVLLHSLSDAIMHHVASACAANGSSLAASVEVLYAPDASRGAPAAQSAPGPQKGLA